MGKPIIKANDRECGTIRETRFRELQSKVEQLDAIPEFWSEEEIRERTKKCLVQLLKTRFISYYARLDMGDTIASILLRVEERDWVTGYIQHLRDTLHTGTYNNPINRQILLRMHGQATDPVDE